ncbi:MAG: helix-turn-helix transcriptional regulator [Actinomycetota bacterium]
MSGGRGSGGEPSDRWPNAQLLTVDELARLLRIPKATIYRWRSTGAGPRGYSIGRHVRFRWVDVEAWLDERADDDPLSERS